MSVRTDFVQHPDAYGRYLVNNAKNQTFVLLDNEEEYADLMSDFLRKQRNLPWNIRTYTDVEKLMEQECTREIGMLAVSESAYDERLETLHITKIVILNESGVRRLEGMTNIDKYQQAENVLRDLLEIYMEIMGEQPPGLFKGYNTKFIGLYSPIRRCMQTSFALTMSQLLAAKYRTLYLNFEQYAGLTVLLPDSHTRDLADLLYFLNSDAGKFKLRMQTIVRQNGDLHYVPPMKVGQNLLSVTETEWMNLLKRIEESGEYDYVILDLSESVQGLFNILRVCTVVFTLTKNDRISEGKLLQYEQALALCEYEDIIGRTRRCNVPKIRRFPEELGQYTKGELADYVRMQLGEL